MVRFSSSVVSEHDELQVPDSSRGAQMAHARTRGYGMVIPECLVSAR
jgi:hypothetical protein